jgi:signal peptidase I
MNIDFSLILVVATLVTGVIWGLDSLLFARKRKASGEVDEKTSKPKEPLLVEYARFLFPVVLIVLLLRGFLAEPFRIPSGSMLSTLEIGDFILVNKFAYGIRPPVWNKKIIDINDPQRGDVIVFRYPENPSVDYIKRVVGVPGDEIAYYNKVLYINGKQIQQEPLGVYQAGFPNLKRFKEQLDDVEHDILINVMYPAGDFVVKVPPNSYFVLGDNRDNSRDSRFWGFVPDENLVGKAFMIWMNWEWGNWPKWYRIGTIIE